MSRRRTSVIRPDGRVRLRVDIPPDVLAAAERIVEETGLDLEAVLGDLAATALPDALAEAADLIVGQPARNRLGQHTKQPLARRKARGTPNVLYHQVVVAIVAADGPKPMPDGGDGGTT